MADGAERTSSAWSSESREVKEIKNGMGDLTGYDSCRRNQRCERSKWKSIPALQ